MQHDDDEKKRKEDTIKRYQPLEFHKPKLKDEKNKDKKSANDPSPHAPIVPCIKCGKSHRKGARCKPG